MQAKLLYAAFVAPMDRPVLCDAAVLIEAGRIAAIGNASQLRREHPHAIAQDLGNTLITPGLVNPHAHLELSDLQQGPSPETFSQWLLSLMARWPKSPDELAQRTRQSIAIGVAQCHRFGVTTVGDITLRAALTRPQLKEMPIRVVSFGEVAAMAQRRDLLDQRFAIAADVARETERLRVGISPHAPYSIEPAGYARCLEFARRENRPLATHLAETPDEGPFLQDHTGPFRQLWNDVMKAWDDQVPRFAGGPIRFAQKLGLLEFPSLLAHVNYCDEDEMAILAAGRASVVYCPRTHAYFRHPPHRWRDMLAHGINVAVGTDSCASSPDLNLLDDIRLLHRLAPDVPAQQLWQMATTRAAAALNMADQIGSLAPGKRADLAAWPVHGDDPLLSLLESHDLPLKIWLDGEPIASPC